MIYRYVGVKHNTNLEVLDVDLGLFVGSKQSEKVQNRAFHNFINALYIEGELGDTSNNQYSGYFGNAIPTYVFPSPSIGSKFPALTRGRIRSNDQIERAKLEIYAKAQEYSEYFSVISISVDVDKSSGVASYAVAVRTVSGVDVTLRV